MLKDVTLEINGRETGAGRSDDAGGARRQRRSRTTKSQLIWPIGWKLIRRAQIPALILIFFMIDLALGMAYILNELAGRPYVRLTAFLDLGKEGNLPTWYSSIQWFCVANPAGNIRASQLQPFSEKVMVAADTTAAVSGAFFGRGCPDSRMARKNERYASPWRLPEEHLVLPNRDMDVRDRCAFLSLICSADSFPADLFPACPWCLC